MAEDEATGRCLCGAVRITLTGDHQEVGACHCATCRRWGSGPSMSIDVGKEIAIEGRDHVRVYRSSEWAERAFCGTCGTSLYYRTVATGGYSLSAGLLDDQSGLTLTSQVFIDAKPAYYAFANQTRTRTGAELVAPPADEEGR